MNESKIENGQPTLQQHNVSGSFMCAHGAENKCKEQCFTCSEDEKCDDEWANACPLCKRKDLFDVSDHYTVCNRCGFSFVG